MFERLREAVRASVVWCIVKYLTLKYPTDIDSGGWDVARGVDACLASWGPGPYHPNITKLRHSDGHF